MSSCCSHTDQEHRVATSCHEQVHYPDEDYPCLCEGFTPRADAPDRCAGCGHLRNAHETVRVCRPASGAVCGCRRPV